MGPFGRCCASAAASTENLTLDVDTIKVANSRKAHRLLHAAQGADATGRTALALKIALFKAHLTGGETISDQDTLVRRRIGLHPDNCYLGLATSRSNWSNHSGESFHNA